MKKKTFLQMFALEILIVALVVSCCAIDYWSGREESKNFYPRRSMQDAEIVKLLDEPILDDSGKKTMYNIQYCEAESAIGLNFDDFKVSDDKYLEITLANGEVWAHAIWPSSAHNGITVVSLSVPEGFTREDIVSVSLGNRKAEIIGLDQVDVETTILYRFTMPW